MERLARGEDIFRALALNGAVAQMGERVVRNDEVRGSIPLGSTSAFAFAPFRPANGDVLRFWFSLPTALSLSKGARRFSTVTIFGSD